ncbi:MAG: TonB-dependent receptor, partial [Rothia sp. (in: high G+C Gram-positive bacteria)]|uniref:TonB-dependent receptor domain-containing protein n=1 Tax=Rothia sp. (in: high G+C Gram-positive bacteria) TaxID=1885016 RepID=UPI0026E052BB
SLRTHWAAGSTAVGAELRDEYLLSTALGTPLDSTAYRPIPGETGRYYTRQARRTNTAYFLEHRIHTDRWQIVPGLLLQHNSMVRGGFRLYPGLDMSYRPTAALRLTASYNYALRLPTFTDLWYKSPTQEGNVNLQPEETHTVQLGAELSLPALTFSARAHYRRGTHTIDWVMYTPDDRYHATNFSLDAYGAGMDFSLDLTHYLGERQPLRHLTLSYAWLGQERRRGPAYYKSNYAFEYLRHKAVVRLSHQIYSLLKADWTLRLQQRTGGYLLYKEGKPSDSLVPYGTHALLDLRLTWETRPLSLWLDLNNVTATRYYDLGNVPQPGFTLLAGLRWKLK